jgi:hypothetical protein
MGENKEEGGEEGEDGDGLAADAALAMPSCICRCRDAGVVDDIAELLALKRKGKEGPLFFVGVALPSFR